MVFVALNLPHLQLSLRILDFIHARLNLKNEEIQEIAYESRLRHRFATPSCTLPDFILLCLCQPALGTSML